MHKVRLLLALLMVGISLLACSTPIDSPGQEPVATIAAAVPVRTETPTVVPTLTAIPTPTPTTIPTAELPYNRMFVGVYDWDRVFDELSMDVEHDFISWDQPEKISQFILAARTAGRVPLVTIEPWTTVAGNVLLDTGVITDGRALNDAIIQRNAWAVKAHHPQTVLIRFAHEMELVGNYPWSQSDYASYVAAYRHYHDVFEYLGVTNVRWIWSPAGNANSSDYYPGDEYVDYIGVTVLSHGELAFKAGDLLGSSFATIFNDRYRVVSGYEKPIIVAEMGVFPALAVESSDTYKAAWLKAAFAVFPDYPLLHGVVYFNAVNAPTNSEWGRPDWRIGADMLWRPEEMPELK